MPKRRSRVAKCEVQHPQRKTSLVWRFLITYFMLMGISLILIAFEPIKRVINVNELYSRMIVSFTALLLKPFGIVRDISGSIIELKGIALNVAFGCNGLEAFLIYTVAVLSFPAEAKKKLYGIGMGFLILQILNVLRIVGLGLSAVYLEQYFDFLHTYVAQGIMIAIALALFLIWISYAQQENST